MTVVVYNIFFRPPNSPKIRAFLFVIVENRPTQRPCGLSVHLRLGGWGSISSQVTTKTVKMVPMAPCLAPSIKALWTFMAHKGYSLTKYSYRK